MNDDAWQPLTPAVIDTMCTHATAALPKETGGILLGYRTDQGVQATVALHVPDRRAGAATYRRSYRLAARALADALAAEPPDSPVGYVGEWHSHPAPAGPSPIDLSVIADIAGASDDGVLLVVLSRDNAEWRLNVSEVRVVGLPPPDVSAV